MAELIYNVTTKVEHGIHAEWLQWMQNVHMPGMLATGCFAKTLMLKLKSVDDTEGRTYAVQYFARNEQAYEKYLAEFATTKSTEILAKWGDKIASFTTVLEVVN